MLMDGGLLLLAMWYRWLRLVSVYPNSLGESRIILPLPVCRHFCFGSL